MLGGKKLNLKRFNRILNDINEFTSEKDGISRICFSKEERKAKDYIIKLMDSINVNTYEDSIGNLFCKRDGINNSLKTVAIGSHIDSVYKGGKFDGSLGVVTGIEIFHELYDKNIKTEHPIELIIFTCEESARFGISTLGSKYMIGELDLSSMDPIKDKDGISFIKALREYNDNEIIERVSEPKKYECFFELHIEQGPILERERKQIGIVESIASSIRYKLEVEGFASHSGTTPIEYREDAFVGVTKFSNEFSKLITEEMKAGTIGTISDCKVFPGAMNVVPGRCELLIDIRISQEESYKKIPKKINEIIEELKAEDNLKYTLHCLSKDKPALLSSKLNIDATKICEDKGYTYKIMNSGAGHDAMILSKICETSLLFIPSKDGISHNPKECSSTKDIEVGLDLLNELILKSANQINRSVENENY